MGLFDRFKKQKKPTIEDVTLNEVANMTPEELNAMIDSVPKTEEGIRKLDEANTRFAKESIASEQEMISRLEAETDKAVENWIETERKIKENMDYIDNRINELQNLPGYRRTNQVIREQAMELLSEMAMEQERKIKQAKQDAFNKKYFDIIQLLKNPNNDDRYNSLPSDIQLFTCIAFYEEQKEECDFEDLFYEVQNRIIKKQLGEQYSDLNKRLLLSMGILMNLGLLDIKNIADKNNPKMFENIIKKLDLSKYNGRSLAAIISSISEAISKQNGKDGLLNEFFSDKLPINNYEQNEGIKKADTAVEVDRAARTTPKQTPEMFLETCLKKLREKGIPEETIKEYREKDLKYIKANSFEPDKCISSLKEIYDRYDNPLVANIYILNPEEYLKEVQKALIEQGLSEENIQKFVEKMAKNIREEKELFEKRQFKVEDWSINQHTYFEAQRYVDNIHYVEDASKSKSR